MSVLQSVQMQFGRPGAQRPITMAFDCKYPTQKYLYDGLAKGQLCDPIFVQALTDSLTEGDTFVDVGGHVGYFSLLAMGMIGPTGSVFAFEPNPHTYFVLAANAQLNRFANMHTYNCAVGDQLGTAEFNINPQDEGMSSLVVPAAGGTKISVALTTLDHFATYARLDRVRMLKIDVEGFEENVIRGAQGLLSRGAVENIVFEINNSFAGIPRHRDVAIRRYLATLGYSSYLIRPHSADPQGQERFGRFNYLRLPENAQVEIQYGNILSTKRLMEAAV